MRSRIFSTCAVAATFFTANTHFAHASITPTDEIQVYDAGIVDQGHFNLTWHNNFTPNGQSVPAFQNAFAGHHSWNGVTEWAYGVSDWFEAGAYVPVYSLTGDGHFLIDGAKLRALFVVPHADSRTFFYGVNFELSYNAKRWDESRWSGEIRPIVGARFGALDVIVNPIIDTSFNGFKNLEFAPAERVAYNLPNGVAVAVEHYSDYGRFSGFVPTAQQDHTVFGVVDFKIRTFDIEFGAGHGFTAVGDKLVLKLLIAHDF